MILYPVLREIPNPAQPPLCLRGQSVTHVPRKPCYLCLRNSPFLTTRDRSHFGLEERQWPSERLLAVVSSVPHASPSRPRRRSASDPSRLPPGRRTWWRRRDGSSLCSRTTAAVVRPRSRPRSAMSVACAKSLRLRTTPAERSPRQTS